MSRSSAHFLLLSGGLGQTHSQADLLDALVRRLRLFGPVARAVLPSDAMISDTLRPLDENCICVLPDTLPELARAMLVELTQFAFADDDDNQAFYRRCRYLLVRMGDEVDTCAAGLAQIWEGSGLGRCISHHDLVPSRWDLRCADREPIPRRQLRDIIESAAFPGGHGEVVEIAARESCPFHSLLAAVRRPADRTDPTSALRLVMGAFLAGELVAEDVRRFVVGGAARAPDAVETALGEYNLFRESHRPAGGLKFAPLADFVRGKHVLLVEDQLEPQCWDRAIPLLLGAKGGLQQQVTIRADVARQVFVQRQDPAGNTTASFTISHARDCRAALDQLRGRTASPRPIIPSVARDGDQVTGLEDIDIILLDLYSTEEKRESVAGHGGLVKATISATLVEFLETIRALYARELPPPSGTAVVPLALPRIVVFSGDEASMTLRTMYRDPIVSDYLVKTSSGESYKSECFATFKEALVSALKDTACHVLGLPRNQGRHVLEKWIRQFAPADRPTVLHVLRHFRFYSALGIVEAIDRYLESSGAARLSPFECDGDPATGVSLWGGAGHLPGNCWVSYIGRPNKSGPNTLALMSKSRWFADWKRQFRRLPEILSFDTLVARIASPGTESHDQALTMVFFDDVIGSGGQALEYLWKFANSQVREACGSDARWLKFLEALGCNRDPNGAWADLKASLPAEPAKGGALTIDTHLLFAVGIDCASFRSIAWQDAALHEGPPRYFRGKVQVRVCRHATEGKLDRDGMVHVFPDADSCKPGQRKCNCRPLQFTATVHVADLTKSLREICREDGLGISFAEVLALLRRYSGIADFPPGLRSEDFEPGGWKNCYGLVSTYANTPGNTLPIVWASSDRWVPLFPRFFNPWAR